MSSQILCCALERSINIRNPTKLGRTGLKGSRPTKSYRDYDAINGESTEFLWNIFRGLCEGVGDVVGVEAPLAEWRRLFSTESRL